jgi:hypothetical protein
MSQLKLNLALLAGLALLAAAPARAQDSGALLDLLVKKGVINFQEAEDLRVQLTKEFTNNTSAGKLNLGSAISDFRLSGDMRIREQYETQAPQVNPANVTNERFRNRIRFRLNGDVTLQKGWSAGFALETAAATDSGNQTLQDGMDDYAPFLARAYVGWKPNLNWSFLLGKQRPILYTTDLVWDGDINPQGFSEVYTKFLGGKDTLELRAGQYIMDDRNESTAGPAGRDAWLFAQQAVYTKWFGRDEIGNQINSFIIAPGFMKYNGSTLDGLTGEAAFNGTTRYLTNFVLPGEINFVNPKGTGTNWKIYWDFSHNFEAANRVSLVYGILPSAGFSNDANAWLAGIGYGLGQARVKGDYTIRVDYRRVGIGSIDPNINDSDFGFSFLNQEGWKGAFSYAVNDFTNFNVTYFNTKDVQGTLNQATIAARDHTQLLQLDLVVRF